jgi:hypothetical protein
MQEDKSVQDLIVKAALYDGVTTTIRPENFITGDTISITFSRDNRHSATRICIGDKYGDSEEKVLYCCKRTLCNLLFAPYEEIEVNKEEEL